MERFDAIVVGTGGVGSSALYQLAKRGQRVLGLDQFPQAHAKGSSHGQSRIIRQAYFEHPDYVPLLLRAYDLWDEVEKASNRKLFHPVGLLEVGPPDGLLISGVLKSVEEHNLPIEKLSGSEARERFPFVIRESDQVVFEPTGGYLLVEQCVQTHLDLAAQSGAVWKQQSVVDWIATPSHVTVRTETDSYEADRLIVCGGAWSATVLEQLGVSLRIVSKHQYWFEPARSVAEGSKDANTAELPTYFFDTPTGYFYGFPLIDQSGLKVAQHSGGSDHPAALELDSLVDGEDEQLVRSFVSHAMPFCSDKLLSQKACMYTCSPDEHFIVDSHPNHENVLFAAGLSGHGFKFTTVLGEVLADLATNAQPRADIDFLSLRRFSA